MFMRVLLLTLNLKTKKKVDAIRSSFVLAIVVRTWRILKSIFAIFCFITSKKRRKQLKQGKHCVEFTAEMSSKNASASTGSPEFRDDDFSVKDVHRSSRPSKIDDDEMKALVQANKHSTVRKLATALKVSVESVHDHLKSLGFVKELDVWVPHELKEIHLTMNSSNTKKTIRRS